MFRSLALLFSILLVPWGAAAADHASTSCDTKAAACGNDDQSLVQTHLATMRLGEHSVEVTESRADDGESGTVMTAETCTLPSFGRWCSVCPVGGECFDLAVYHSNDIVSNEICNTGFWETRSVAKFGPPGTALDIGTNVGYYSFLLAAAKWTVHSFEPLPQNLELLAATACKNPALAQRVKIHPTGLGAQHDHCVFISDNNNVGDGWTQCGAAADAVKDGYQVRGEFEVQRLDDELERLAIKAIDFVKIDVEGFEFQVFEGAQSLLTKYRPRAIQSEVWPKMRGCVPADYLKMFAMSNYKVSLAPGCADSDDHLNGQIQDFFMCKGDGPALLQFTP